MDWIEFPLLKGHICSALHLTGRISPLLVQLTPRAGRRTRAQLVEIRSIKGDGYIRSWGEVWWVDIVPAGSSNGSFFVLAVRPDATSKGGKHL